MFAGIDVSLSGAMRGAGVAIVPMITAIASNFIRIPCVYILAIMPNNYLGVFYSMGITMGIGAILMSLYYRIGKWHEKGVRVAGPPAGNSFI